MEMMPIVEYYKNFERSYFALSLISCIHMVIGFTYRSSDGVTTSYQINHENMCLSETERFAVIQGLSVPDCVKACGLRQHCQALQYRRRASFCELFLSAEHGATEEGDCVFINGSDIILHMNPCGGCMHGSSCDTALAFCTYQECPNAAVPRNGEILGNMNEENATIKFTCNNGYREKNGVVKGVCLDTGYWSTSAECVRDCDNPPLISNGHVVQISSATASVQCNNGYNSTIATVDCTDPAPWGNISCTRIGCGSPPSVMNGSVVLDTVNGHFYLDIATVLCDNWFLSSTVSITCRVQGIWDNPTDCIDCYPSTPWEYAGKTNVTKNGRPCQRWDSQEPHPHERTDLQYYPETTLADANNYCRNPEVDEYDPWCMTIDPEKDWEYCNITKCPWT